MTRLRRVFYAVGLLALLAAPAAHAQSDSWQGATATETNVVRSLDTTPYTSAGEPMAPGSGIVCGQSGSDVQVDRTAWFKVIGTGGRIILSSADSTFDTVIGVYQPNAAPSDATNLLCSD